MGRRKRASKRRWKRRAAAGRAIPLVAIVEHQLERWFEFDHIGFCTEFYRVKHG
jgi:hypothetical protein